MANHYPFERSDGTFVIVGRSAEHIASVDEWLMYAPPLSPERQWCDGKSAKEGAKQWFPVPGGPPRVPIALRTLFDSDPRTRGFRPGAVLPEHDTRLPESRGGPRRHDLLLLGMVGADRMAIGIETKTDEPLDGTLKQKLAEMWRARTDKGLATDFYARLQTLTWSLFGRPLLTSVDGQLIADEELVDIPYQLVAGAAGTLVEAGQSDATAVFVVWGFRSPSYNQALIAENCAGLDRFVQAVTGMAEIRVARGSLLTDPLAIPGSSSVRCRPEIPAAPLLIASAETALGEFANVKPTQPPTTRRLQLIEHRYRSALNSDVVRHAIECWQERITDSWVSQLH